MPAFRVVVASLGPAVRVQDILQGVHRKYNYSSVIGMCRTVAVGGYSLGGGQGLLARRYGLGADNVVGTRLVLANGTRIDVTTTADTYDDPSRNQKHNRPDILWALRGAGQNNFGVVTEIRYKFYPSQDEQVFLNTMIPMRDMPRFFHDLANVESELPGQVGAFLSAGNKIESDKYSIFLWYSCESQEDLATGKRT